VFQSRQFGDEEILQQVASPKHQGPLSAHGHTATGNPLNQMGPCFVTLAQVRNERRECGFQRYGGRGGWAVTTVRGLSRGKSGMTRHGGIRLPVCSGSGCLSRLRMMQHEENWSAAVGGSFVPFTRALSVT
jgi:hypothetical protein